MKMETIKTELLGNNELCETEGLESPFKFMKLHDNIINFSVTSMNSVGTSHVIVLDSNDIQKLETWRRGQEEHNRRELVSLRKKIEAQENQKIPSTIHICRKCESKRECGYICEYPIEELCAICTSEENIDKAIKRDLKVSDLFLDVTGGIHISEEAIKSSKKFNKNIEAQKLVQKIADCLYDDQHGGPIWNQKELDEVLEEYRQSLA